MLFDIHLRSTLFVGMQKKQLGERPQDTQESSHWLGWQHGSPALPGLENAVCSATLGLISWTLCQNDRDVHINKALSLFSRIFQTKSGRMY